MTQLNPYDAFRIFMALKLHFTSDYDYVKYRGKIKISPEAFMARKDRFTFVKLSRTYKAEEYELFVISNLLENSKIYSRDLLSDTAADTFKERQKVNESLAYVFSQDMDTISDWVSENNVSIDAVLEASPSDYPPLLRLYNRKNITIETMVILNKLMKFIPVWNKRITDTIVWPSTALKIEKYEPFLVFDAKRFKQIVLEKV